MYLAVGDGTVPSHFICKNELNYKNYRILILIFCDTIYLIISKYEFKEVRFPHQDFIKVGVIYTLQDRPGLLGFFMIIKPNFFTAIGWN